MGAKEFGYREDIIRIPAQAGSIVILHSLTWHRTNPNGDAGTLSPRLYHALGSVACAIPP